MARKPIEGTVAENTLQYGVGGLNIDGCRVGSETIINQPAGDNAVYNTSWKGAKTEPTISEGRWPANVILDEEAGNILDKQSGERGNGWKKNYGATDYNGKQYDSSTNQCVFGGGFTGKNTYADTGGASRFFYCPKTSAREREEGLVGLETKANAHMATQNGTSGEASKGMERFKTQPKQNFHPTVKPTELMKYLIRLVTPKAGIVLDPFMGSGSTGKAAMQEGMWFVGIEREKEYYEIAKQRIEYEMDKRKFW